MTSSPGRPVRRVSVTAGRITVTEAEEPAGAGEIAPDQVHLPGVFVQQVVEVVAADPWADKRIERRTARRQQGEAVRRSEMALTREQMAVRAARELPAVIDVSPPGCCCGNWSTVSPWTRSVPPPAWS
ncbi:hypothetical protein [Streptomyces sp. NBC_01439]|uniref:hypothetical protein n=1 Tax=Streptomyces sp. NBC_01439 TaxID=2903867 RepID=UPI002E2B314A|nr:hypothetical protein [Streptomyces sp. NBC_01439]